MERLVRNRRKAMAAELWLAWMIRLSAVIMTVTAKPGTIPQCSLSVEREEVTAGGREGLRGRQVTRRLRQGHRSPARFSRIR